MKFHLTSDETNKSTIVKFPVNSFAVQMICDELGIENTIDTQVTITKLEQTSNQALKDAFLGKTVNLDALNMLTQEMDMMLGDTSDRFIRALTPDATVREMIQLLPHLEEITVIPNQPDLCQLASKLLQEQNPNLTPEDITLSTTEANKFLCDYVMGQTSQLTSQGELRYGPEDMGGFYTGKCLPQINYGSAEFGLRIESPLSEEYDVIHLPCPEAEFAKSLDRLGITEESQLADLSVTLEESACYDEVHPLFQDVTLDWNDVIELNEFTEYFNELYGEDVRLIQDWMELSGVSGVEGMSVFVPNFCELKLHPDVHSLSDYAAELLEDPQIDYIDYDKYGESKLAGVPHVFTEKGLLTYSGSDPKMLEALSDMQDAQESSLTMGGQSL